MKKLFMLACLLSLALWVKAAKDYTQYVNPMMGTESTFELSTGNTYPVIAMPWLPKSVGSNRLTSRVRGLTISGSSR